MRNWLKQLFFAAEKTSSVGADRPPIQSGDDAMHKAQGDAYLHNGDFAAAAQCYRQAIAINPDIAKTHSNLGFALKEQGLLVEAEACLDRALVIDPTIADAHYILGTLSQAQGQPDIACVHFRKALALAPDFEFAQRDLCLLLFQQSRLEDAKQVAIEGIALNPHFSDLHFYLGNLHQEQQQFDLAMESYQKALALQPERPEILASLGLVLLKKEDFDQAAMVLRKALALNPDLVDVWNNLGNALLNAGQLDEAIKHYRHVLQIDPNYARAHYNLGFALTRLRRFDDALESYRHALQINPDYPEVHSNLGHIFIELGRIDDALASYRRALQIKPDYFEVHSNLLFTCNYMSDQPASAPLQEAIRFGGQVARQARQYVDWPNVPDANRLLRVGLVSGDLCNHPVGYFVEGILAALAADAVGRLELIAYPSVSLSDALTDRIRAKCHGWHPAIGLSDESLAQLIRDDGIDILLDLSGHSAHNRLPMFAWKPAPVQVSWLGYFATTGVATIDYLIADPWTLPTSEESNFTETIWRLPETRLCFTAPDIETQAHPLPALANAHITFGCFNNLAKINDAVVALWARVLIAVPDSRLFLKAKQLGEASVRARTFERFAAHDVAADRLVLNGYTAREHYLNAYQQIDIALDPFPFTGGTTTAEALWMGVPVLTLAGESFVARQGVGLLMNAGLPDWIATDADDYVARAVRHAGDLQRLTMLRCGLRQQVLRSPIFDAPRFAHHFEAVLRAMWTQWCNRPSEQPAT